MKFHNELCQAWCMLDDDTKTAILFSDKTEVMDEDGEWGNSSCDPADGVVYRAPIVEKQPLGPKDIKQGDALYDGDHTVSMITDWTASGVFTRASFFSYDNLEVKALKIRSIGETDWRPCHK